MVTVAADGKPALTRFGILQANTTASLLQAEPVTGRTHQIRVHAQYAGHPLVGDPKYGLEDVNRRFRALGCKRLFLHAASLGLKLPSGKTVKIEARLPADLQSTLDNLFN